MKNSDLIDKLSSNPKVKNSGLKKEFVASLIETYNELMISSLLEKGYLNLGNGLSIEVVQLLDRIHVLRGVTYKSSRRYKLKVTMNDKVYEELSTYYDKLKEDIS